jgi:hypothetical protein
VQTKLDGGKSLIFDLIRKKYVVLTPEEWVRQHLIHYLIREKGYSSSLISVETPLKYAKMNKRSDVVVYGRDGQSLLLAECKAPEISLTQKVLEQIGVYNQTIHAPFLLVTNGLQHYCLSISKIDGIAHPLSDIPDYAHLLM